MKQKAAWHSSGEASDSKAWFSCVIAVRNPLSAAISALSFVSVGVAEHVPNPKHKQSILEDVGVMDASLQFINEVRGSRLETFSISVETHLHTVGFSSPSCTAASQHVGYPQSPQ